MADGEQIVAEFRHLLEKSQQLFAGLRDLPQFGRSQWQPYFQRTFEVYTKLWQFQQTHRVVLESPEFGYNLQRWQIGEIASKIGQLYYHYYLRTSEANYLAESRIFYDAIREREYFKGVASEPSPQLFVKKLRYYARYIVVCLLLNRTEGADMSTVNELREELTESVSEYVRVFKPADANEWQMVIREIDSFLSANVHISISDQPERRLSVRQTDLGPVKDLPSGVSAKIAPLAEALLVGNHAHQVKFSELTLDMYRMLQSLEREPTGKEEKPGPGTLANCHKYLLYRPSFSQLMVFVATAFKELPDGHAMLVYLSADGVARKAEGAAAAAPAAGAAAADEGALAGGYASGGISTNPRRASASSEHAMCPGDLVPFTRKPLFLVVDSDNSVCFKSLPVRAFDSPVVVLMSPTALPPGTKDMTVLGSLFSFFLSDPLTAFWALCECGPILSTTVERCQATLKTAFDTARMLLLTTEGVPPAYASFALDPFLGSFLARYMWACAVFASHKDFQGHPEFQPCCHPPLPAALTGHAGLVEAVTQLAGHLDVAAKFAPPAK